MSRFTFSHWAQFTSRRVKFIWSWMSKDDLISRLKQARGVIERYRQHLPVSDSTPIVSLGEGNTPLIYSPRLSERVGRQCEVFVKYEGLNPTGSFKDRGMTVAVSKALERGARALI